MASMGSCVLCCGWCILEVYSMGACVDYGQLFLPVPVWSLPSSVLSRVMLGMFRSRREECPEPL